MVDLEHLATYVPRRVLRSIAAAGSDRLRPGVDRFTAAVLFADISGFTDLSDRLGRNGAAGTEELGAIVNDYFRAMLGPVAGHGGDVLTMAGDALVVVWDARDPGDAQATLLRAVQCALQIQQVHPVSAAGRGLAVRIGIGAGDAGLFRVGGIEDRWETLPTGGPFRQMGIAGNQARPGEVVVSPEAWGLVSGAAGGTPLDDGYVRIESIATPPPASTGPPRDVAGAERRIVEAQLPKPIRFLLRDAGERWVAEMRPVTCLFVELRALAGESPSLDLAQEMMEIVQTAGVRFGGTTGRTNVDEKGLYLMMSFGLPPASHEDDPYRAVQAAMAMRAALREKGLEAGFGIATGRVFCGAVGDRERREYAVIGRAANLASRLTHCSRGEIFCDETTFQSAAARFRFSAAAPLRLKGIPQPIPVFFPTGPSAPASVESRMVGHQAEFARTTRAIHELKAGRGFIGIIEGEAGIGKSTLLQQWSDEAARGGIRLLRGSAVSIHATTPYFVWQDIVGALLGLSENGAAAERREQLLLASRGQDWERLTPLLNDILDLGIPDNPITTQISGKMRAYNTQELVATLVAGAAAEQPLGIVLEDCHWMDSASLAVAEVVANRVQPIVMLLSSRILTGERRHSLDPFLALPAAGRLRLEALGRDDCIALAARRLCVRKVAKPVADLITAKSQGNPFFSVEIVFALREHGYVIIENDECKPVPGLDLSTVKFPDNVQGIIMRRVDGLDAEAQLTAKVASVIGRAFSETLLRDSFPPEVADPRVGENLLVLQRERLIEKGDGDEYTFRHAIVEEAVYDRLLLAQRKTLHERVALALEKSHADNPEIVAPLLGHHWLRTGDEKKAGHYFGLAGGRAVRSGAYQDGLDFLARAMRLTRASAGPDDADRDALWQMLSAEACFGLGKIEESWVAFREVARLLGRPVAVDPQAGRLLQQIGGRLVRRISGTRRGGAEEIARLRMLAGSYEMLSLLDLFSNRMTSSLSEALESLGIAEHLGDSPEYARALALMAVASSLVPSRHFAERYARAAIKVATRLNHESTMARVREFIGMYQLGEGRWEQAEENFLKAIAGFQVVGDRRREIECTCLYSTWNHYRGDFARRVGYGRRVFELAMATGDLQAQAWGMLDQIESLLNLGDFERVRALGDDLKRHLGQNIYGADEIMAYGLLAALELRVGRLAEALPHAERALEAMTRMSPTIVYNLEAYAAVTEVYLKAWRITPADDPARGGFEAKAREACQDTRRFAKIFRIAGSRALLLSAEECELAGDLPQAIRLSRDALAAADRLRMPYEQALAHRQLGRLLPAGDRRRDGELVRARELFSQLAATYDLGATEAV